MHCLHLLRLDSCRTPAASSPGSLPLQGTLWGELVARLHFSPEQQQLVAQVYQQHMLRLQLILQERSQLTARLSSASRPVSCAVCAVSCKTAASSPVTSISGLHAACALADCSC